jgi:DNA recombination protein RmuC
METAALFILAAAIVAAALLLRRPAAAPVPAADPAALQALQAMSRGLGQLQAELGRLAVTQAELRQDVQRGREASVLQLAEAAQGIRGELGQAQRALAEVKALEQGRARQMDQAADSIKRLEAVVAGSGTRGAAGENILSRALAQLPPDMLEVNVAFGNKCVEYALRLPGGRYLPIDSKWTSVASLERLDVATDPAERRKLIEQVGRDVRARVRDMTKYLDPERTLALGLLAVPDAVYAAAPEVHGDGYREGVLVVPYSLALPYVLALYRLVIRFGASVDTDQLAARVRALGECLRKLDEEVEGRLSKGLVQVQNARDALRDHVAGAQRAADRLVVEAEPVDDFRPAPRPAVALVKS